MKQEELKQIEKEILELFNVKDKIRYDVFSIRGRILGYFKEKFAKL